MMNQRDILSTIDMIDQQHLDIRTVTMGISLLSCADEAVAVSCSRIYDKICRYAGALVPVCEEIETEFGIPIVNKRISGPRGKDLRRRFHRRIFGPGSERNDGGG